MCFELEKSFPMQGLLVFHILLTYLTAMFLWASLFLLVILILIYTHTQVKVNFVHPAVNPSAVSPQSFETFKYSRRRDLLFQGA